MSDARSLACSVLTRLLHEGRVNDAAMKYFDVDVAELAIHDPPGSKALEDDEIVDGLDPEVFDMLIRLTK